jgi:hypothetical protein
MREETPGAAGDNYSNGNKAYKQAFHGLNLVNLIQLNQLNQLFLKTIDNNKKSLYICSPKFKDRIISYKWQIINHRLKGSGQMLRSVCVTGTRLKLPVMQLRNCAVLQPKLKLNRF